ncbi:Fe(3+) ABC transporter substrate-binding protein [Propylenella binzhouense]|uniref:Fe(3+) ABC transporter substrate-binding protein n=1 Tax=Propylenella binzhouense TaxID=2555902 RepID=A0A964T7Q8_9HYPH|nr:Fe(3+) ABC transporter substrate-binding protein [Propylenella binzhouense]MYZ50086.1 Fe(3+) ABC transporter substrate-binding protein [Propylenella binzhouense]
MTNNLSGPAGRILAGILLAAVATPAVAAGVVNVYTYRQPELIQPLLDAFTKETGIETRVIFADRGLEERIRAEGRNSPADVLLTVDINRLAAAKEAGVTQPLKDEAIEANVPAEYRDPDGEWFGLTRRGRVVYASKERVPENAITYEELADPKWKGRICTRSGQHVYNIALFSSMIAHHGADYTKNWLTGLKDNLAVKPAGSDRDQAKAIYAGQCDIALGNTYYVGLMMTNDKEPEQKEWAAAIKVIMPNANDRGTHVNISGMSLAKYAPNRDNAVKLMEFLASDEAQRIYAETNQEYPVEKGIPISDIVASFGDLKADSLPLAAIADHRQEASELVDDVGYDDGPSS